MVARVSIIDTIAKDALAYSITHVRAQAEHMRDHSPAITPEQTATIENIINALELALDYTRNL